MITLIRICLFLTLICQIYGRWKPDETHGFGSQYPWEYDLKTSLNKSKKLGLPVMAIIHESWCEECVNLAEKFQESEKFKGYYDQFVWLNCIGDCGVTDDYELDGSYIPRIVFIAPGGRIMNEIYNKRGNKHYKYYYTTVPHILDSMKACLKSIKRPSLKSNPRPPKHH